MVFSVLGLMLLGFPILVLLLIAYMDTGKGLFRQRRIGQYGRPFIIYKIKTLQECCLEPTRYGAFLRRSKLDELPQLANILLGQMSFVGPRPDVPGYYDRLQGEARKLLELKPGLCSRAALKYKDEEAILAQQPNPLQYNDLVLFPDKVRMNLEYYHHRSFMEDIRVMGITVWRMIGLFPNPKSQITNSKSQTTD